MKIAEKMEAHRVLPTIKIVGNATILVVSLLYATQGMGAGNSLTAFYPGEDNLKSYSNASNTGNSYLVAPFSGVAGISGNGGATYSFSVDLPRAAAGFAPQLSVTYSSFNENGIMGNGFSLDGIPIITRGGREKFYDGVKANVSFLDGYDAFYLNGKRLISKGNNTYCVEDNPAQLVYKNGSGFWYKTLDGVRYEFYFKAAIVIPAYNQAYLSYSGTRDFTYAYNLSRAVDSKGNCILYEYIQNEGAGVNLKRIKYSGKEASLINQVDFEYAMRNDIIQKWLFGSAVKQDRLLTKISVYTKGTKYLDYSFKYDYSDLNGAFLKEVNKTSHDGSSYCPIYFSWGRAVSASEVATPLSFPNAKSISNNVGDFNGDGKDDLLYKSIYYSNGDGTFRIGETLNETIYTSSKVISGSSQEESLHFDREEGDAVVVDLNGDGKVDLLRLVKQQYCYPDILKCTQVISYVKVFLSGSSGIDSQGVSFVFDSDNGMVALTRELIPIDLAGSMPVPENPVPDLGGGSSDYQTSIVELTFKKLSPTVKIRDVNGDGISEIVVLNPKYRTTIQSSMRTGTSGQPVYDYSYTYLGTTLDVYGFRNGTLELKSSVNTGLPENSQNARITLSFNLSFVDIDGNGTDEIVLDSGDAYSYSDGSGLAKLSVKFPYNNGAEFENLLGDANIKAYAEKVYPYSIQCYSLSPDYTGKTALGSLLNEVYLTSADLNGDGKKEVVTLGSAIYKGLQLMPLKVSQRSSAVPELDIPIEEPVDEYFGNPILVKSFENGRWVTADTLCFVKIPRMISEEYKYVPDYIQAIPVNVNNDEREDLLLFWNRYVVDTRQSKPVITLVEGKSSLVLGCAALSSCKRTKTDYSNEFIYLDYDGDGVLELYDFKNGKIIDMGYNTKDRLLAGVKDGFNRETKFEYAHLSDPAVYSTSSSYAASPYATSLQPLCVVKSMQSGDGIGGFIKSVCRYSDLALDKGGRGILGFLSRSVYNEQSKQEIITRYSVFDEKKVLYPSRKEVRVNGNLAQEESSVFSLVHQSGVNGYFLRLESTAAKNLVNGVDVNTIYGGYNEWGVATSVSTSRGDGWGEEIATTYNSSLIQDKLLPAKKVVKSIYNGKIHQVETTYSYSSTGDPITENTISEGKSLSKEMLYDDFGNCTQLSNAGVVKKYTFDPTGRFVVSESLGDELMASYVYDDFGNLTSTKDQNNLETRMSYNSAGMPVSKTFPDGTSETSTIEWSSDPQYAYSIATVTSGKPAVRNFFDMFGRNVKTVSAGFNGEVKAEKAYNNLGLPVSLSDAAYTSESAPATTFTYDEHMRLKSESGPTTSKAYSYSGKNIEITDYLLGLTVTKQMDAAGKLKKSTDLNPVSYDYTAGGQLAAVEAAGSTWRMEFDGFGNQTKLVDPNAGSYTMEYNAKGQLVASSTPVGSTSATYDMLGRPQRFSNGEFQVSYSYDRQLKGLPDVVEGNGISQSYTYDRMGRATGYRETIQGQNYDFSFTYDSEGRMQTLTYPNGYTLKYGYNSNGFLSQIGDAQSTTGFICRLVDATAQGLPTRIALGNNLQVVKTYNQQGRATSIIDGKTAQTYTYSNPLQLTERVHSYDGGSIRLSEQLEYDRENRLVAARGVVDDTYTYSGNGNITSKASLGSFVYDSSRPHALAFVNQNEQPLDSILSATQDITYTAFGKVKTITEGDYSAEFTYGPDGDMRIEEIKFQGATIRKRIRIGDSYELIQQPGKPTRELCYVKGFDGFTAVSEKTAGSDAVLYYLHKDHLGSIIQITGPSGIVRINRSYDAWGNPRNPQTGQVLATTNWGIGKGYTGHDHLPWFKLINMQGRLYDPKLCRFLSADPYIQAPEYSQSYNRYSYCFNNPLAYVDPTGYSSITVTDPHQISQIWYFLNLHGAGNLSFDAIWNFTSSVVGGSSSFYLTSVGGEPSYLYTGAIVVRGGGRGFTVDPVTYYKAINDRNALLDWLSSMGKRSSWVNSNGQGLYPIDNPYISSDYGVRNGVMHNGVDFVNMQQGAVNGKPVYSITSGKIVRLVTLPDGNRAGVRVRVQSPDGYQYNYFHLEVGSNSHLQFDMTINKGDVLGKVGNTGASRGAHLHFEIWDPKGRKISPYDIYPDLYNVPHR